MSATSKRAAAAAITATNDKAVNTNPGPLTAPRGPATFATYLFDFIWTMCVIKAASVLVLSMGYKLLDYSYLNADVHVGNAIRAASVYDVPLTIEKGNPQTGLSVTTYNSK